MHRTARQRNGRRALHCRASHGTALQGSESQRQKCSAMHRTATHSNVTAGIHVRLCVQSNEMTYDDVFIRFRLIFGVLPEARPFRSWTTHQSEKAILLVLFGKYRQNDIIIATRYGEQLMDLKELFRKYARRNLNEFRGHKPGTIAINGVSLSGEKVLLSYDLIANYPDGSEIAKVPIADFPSESDSIEYVRMMKLVTLDDGSKVWQLPQGL